jgi:hypothetical protein
MAAMAVNEPPGELMYNLMYNEIARSGSLASRWSSCATMSLAVASSIGEPMNTILSSKSLLYWVVS